MSNSGARVSSMVRLLCAAVLLSAAVTRAEEDAPVEEPDRPLHRYSFTLSPFEVASLFSGNPRPPEYLLGIPIDSGDSRSVLVAVSAEIRLTRRLAALGLFGLGEVTSYTLSDGKDPKAPPYRTTHAGVYELGLQGRYYVLGGFEHGLYVGMHAQWLGFSFQSQNLPVDAGAMVVAPVVGYKLVFGFGATADITFGWYLLGLNATSGQDISVSVTDNGLLSRLTLGWSF